MFNRSTVVTVYRNKADKAVWTNREQNYFNLQWKIFTPALFADLLPVYNIIDHKLRAE